RNEFHDFSVRQNNFRERFPDLRSGVATTATPGPARQMNRNWCYIDESSGESVMPSVWRPRMKFTSVTPRTLRSLSAGTLIGPGPGPTPGAACGNAVDMAV